MFVDREIKPKLRGKFSEVFIDSPFTVCELIYLYRMNFFGYCIDSITFVKLLNPFLTKKAHIFIKSLACSGWVSGVLSHYSGNLIG